MSGETQMRRLRGFGDTNFVLLAEGESLDRRGASPLPEVVYSFDVQGQDERRWRVRRFEVTEALSSLYECVVDLAAESLYENPDPMLGKYALVQAQRDTVLRRFYGVVRRVEHRGTTASRRLARVFMVPALWVLSQRTDARIFQDMTAVEVVQAVLREAGLYASMLDLRLGREYPAREYCVQYRETDLAFVLRLLESEGITFFFRHEEEGEVLVLADGVQAWDTVRTMDEGPVPIAGAELATHRVESVRHLTWEREVRPSGVVVRDFDFTRPDYKLERMAPRQRDGERVLYEPAPALTLGRYGAGMYAHEDGQTQAQLHHETEQVPGAQGAGEGVVLGMTPGAFFTVTVAGAHIPEQRYLVTKVEHVGEVPEELLQGTHERPADDDRYRNRFECTPLEVAFHPPRKTPRPVIAGFQTAIVTGPAGEEVYTDEHGRIKVQFHWDRQGTSDEHSSCWLRMMQGPWAGGGWGFQFIPRVGMEVAVSFAEGDPDRPVVTGALYDRFYVQNLTTRVSGRARREVAGADDASVHDDQTTRIKGHQVTIVGRYEAKRSSVLHVEGTSLVYSSKTNELQSEKDILLRCGRSMIRLTPTRLELISPEVIVRGGENRVTVGGEKVRIRAKSQVIIGAEKVTVKSSGAR